MGCWCGGCTGAGHCMHSATTWQQEAAGNQVCQQACLLAHLILQRNQPLLVQMVHCVACGRRMGARVGAHPLQLARTEQNNPGYHYIIIINMTYNK